MDLFDLVAKITLDSSEYEKGVDSAKGKAGGLASAIGGGLATAAKVGTAAITAASGAVAALVKSSIDGYAEYEQLVGGISTMFEDLSWDVEQNANRAFQTAGLSANEYMETVMGFSAALNQSLIANEGNIARAADLSDQIITDMADNANKMGTSMESIQNAYSGFAKQNYTMLDNLKLGYGGTKEEMERLLADAEKLTGQKYDVSNFADIAEAIHAVQTEIGITGTTALEASETISGSVASMKSAWKNLVVGFGDKNADIGALIGNVVDSAKTALGNIIPVATQALSGIATAIHGIAPVIAEEFPALIEEILPPLLSAAQTLIMALIGALPELLSVLTEQAPVIIDSLLSAITAVLPSVIMAGFQIITAIGMGILQNLPAIIDAAFEIIMQLADAIIEDLPELIPAIIAIIVQIVDKLTEPETLSNLIDAAIEIMIALANGIIDSLPKLIEKAPVIIEHLVTAIVENVPKLARAALDIIVSLVQGIIDNLPKIMNAAMDIIDTLLAGLANLWDNMVQIGTDIVKGIWEGIKGMADWLWGQVTGFFENVVGGIKDFLGIHSPSTVFAAIGDNMAQGIGVGFGKAMDGVSKSLLSDVDSTIGRMRAGFDIGKQTVDVTGSGWTSGGAIANGQPIEIPLIIDGAVLARATYRYNQSEQQRHGNSLIYA